MEEDEVVLGEVGTVVEINIQQQICRIQYNTGTYWFYHAACRKVSIIEEGDRVKVLDDELRVRDLQSRHGGWTDNMKSILGDIGVVLSIDPDVGDLEVKFQDSTFLLNMSCCVKLFNDGDIVSKPLATKPLSAPQFLPGEDHQLETVLQRMKPTVPQTPLPPLDIEDRFLLQPGIPSSDDDDDDDDDGDDEEGEKKGYNDSMTEAQDVTLGSGGSAAESDSDDEDDETVILHLNGMTIGKGLRVVRGKDWKWEDQDGGKGHLGTVVELGLQREGSVPPQCVIIQWDEGNRNTYRVGYENAYDLRIYDNAGLEYTKQFFYDLVYTEIFDHLIITCSVVKYELLPYSFISQKYDCRGDERVKHNVKCDGDCGEEEIMGFLWQCATCGNVNLCSQCYHAEKHDIKHPFNRIDSPGEEPVAVPKRQICQRNKVLGIFERAKVVRGPDWRWQDQDGLCFTSVYLSAICFTLKKVLIDRTL
ncbi:hypothetical protein KUTeg_001780 [Tegillarca granosa]|uniref:Uncharacterized protein n=1 Tax=Tegillarca granosa TaxID=220873 RepID=A0ABQ9FSF7_TEGGR|nr:hypothetical protein KUTeg_001780 [Tegillarca granosa]